MIAELRRGVWEFGDHAFVPKDHAVVHFLANRPYLIGCNIREQRLTDGYYKIGRPLLHFICRRLANFNVVLLQRWIRSAWLPGIEPIRQSKREAVAMCLHSRLGQASGLGALGKDLVALIVGKSVKDVEDDRIQRGRLVRPARVWAKPRYMTAPVWIDLSKIDLNKLNGVHS